MTLNPANIFLDNQISFPLLMLGNEEEWNKANEIGLSLYSSIKGTVKPDLNKSAKQFRSNLKQAKAANNPALVKAQALFSKITEMCVELYDDPAAMSYLMDMLSEQTNTLENMIEHNIAKQENLAKTRHVHKQEQNKEYSMFRSALMAIPGGKDKCHLPASPGGFGTTETVAAAYAKVGNYRWQIGDHEFETGEDYYIFARHLHLPDWHKLTISEFAEFIEDRYDFDLLAYRDCDAGVQIELKPSPTYSELPVILLTVIDLNATTESE